MLVAALCLTILGFAFLVAAVASGQIVWAWACIGVGAVGLLLLLVDLIRGHGTRDDEPATGEATSDEASAAANRGRDGKLDEADASSDR